MLLFLSHSGADMASAIELKRRIIGAPAARDAGLEVWLDKDELQAGQDTWQPQLEDAITRATAFCVYVGSQGVTNWVEREVRLGLSRATGADAIPFIPALAGEARSATLPPFARQHQSVRDPLGNPEALADLIAAALGRARQPPLVDEPFVGLRAMGEREAHLFFGREDEVVELAGKLRRHSIVAVVSDSGAGKSSLVRAGLAPAFRGGALEPDSRLQPVGVCRHVVVMRPGGDPQEGLKRGVDEAAEALGRDGDARSSVRRRIDLGDASETAYAIRCDLPSGTETLLVVDQFEELLTQAKPDDARRFVAFLLALVDPGAQRGVRVVLTIRADYFNLLKPHSELFARLAAEDGAAQLRLKRVSDAGLASLVRSPLKMAGHQDAGDQGALLTAIRQDVSDRPGDLALIQMALFATWRKARQERSTLAAAYAQVGGVLGALAHEGERVRTEELRPAQQELLLPLFARLVRLGDTGGATRRAAALADLGTDREGLARKLAGDEGGRLLQTGEASVEIAHEALITQWPWLQSEIQGAAPDIRRLGRLQDAATEWEQEGRRRDMLPGAGALADFQSLQTRRGAWLSESERQYLDHAVGSARSARLARLAAVAALVLLSAGMGLFGWQAMRSERRAQAAATTALKAEAAERAAAEAARASERRALESERQAVEAAEQANRAAWIAKRNEVAAMLAFSSIARDAGRPDDAAKLALAAWPRHGGSTALQSVDEVLVDQAVRALESAVQRLEVTPVTPIGPPVPGSRGMASFAFSQDGNRLAVGTAEGTVQLWDITKGELLGGRMAKLASEITSVAFSMDGIRLAIGSSDGTVRIWDLSTNELIDPPFRRDAGEPDPIEVIAFTPDGRLASASRRGAKLLDFTNPPIDIPLPSGPLVTSVAISPDGGRFAAGLADGTLRLLDLATQTAIDPPSGRKTDWLGSLTLSSSGARAAAVGLEPWVWDVSMGKIIGIPLGGPETVSKVALSPDGARLAVAYQDGTLRLLDLATGAQIGRPFGGNRERGTQSMSFSPNGLRLATSTIDGTVEVWDLSAIPDGNLFAITCSWLPGPNGVPDTDIAGALASVGALIENVDPICGPGYDPPGAWWMTPGEADGTLPRRAVVPEPSGEP